MQKWKQRSQAGKWCTKRHAIGDAAITLRTLCRLSRSLALRSASDLCDQTLKSWIAAQGIEHRIELDKHDIGAGTVFISTFEPCDSLFFFAQSQVHKCEGVVGDVTSRCQLLQLGENLKRFIAPIHFRADLRDESEHSRVAVQLGGFLVFLERFRQLSLHFQRFAEDPVGVIKSRIDFYRLVELFDGLVITTRKKVIDSKVRVNDEGKRIELDGAFALGNGAIEIAGE